MKLTKDEEKLLTSGGEELTSKFAAVIDWRGEFEEIVEDFGRFLPDGFLSFEEGDDSLTVRSRNGVAEVPLDGDPPFGLDLAAAIAALLPPDYEACAIRDTLGSDTHCYLVRSYEWWSEARRAHPECRRIFAKPSELPGGFKLRKR